MAVLGLLSVGPLHPYGMQRLIKLWGKDQVVNVGQRANLYKTIKRLDAAGYIAVRQTERDQQYPERTVYELTEKGRQAGPDWLAAMVATPRKEFPEFPAALSFVMLLGPDRARSVLEQRLAAVREILAKFDAELTEFGTSLPRVTLIETEYQQAVGRAEADWLVAVIEDLRTGRLTWSEDLMEMAKSYLSE